jgi:RES domain-containing protein
LRLYRIADRRYSPASGDGARLFGARWNSAGRAAIYACTTYAGAMLEKLVHTGRRIPKHQVCVVFEVPDDLRVSALKPAEHVGWDAPDCVVRRAAGDAWLQAGNSCVLLVPSVVFDVERNALVNPSHPDFARIGVVSIEAVRWDDRLFTATRTAV